MTEYKITCKINTPILYPWKIGDYFKYKGQRYRIEIILEEENFSWKNGVIGEILGENPLDDRILTSLVVGVLVK